MTSRVHLRFAAWRENAPRGPFWIYFGAALLFNFGFSVFFFLFNLYLLGLGYNERSLGLIGSCMALGSLAGTIPAGVLAQRLGLRFTLVGGIALAVTASVLRVSVAGSSAQLALAVLSGLALCTWAVCLSPVVAALATTEQRPFAFSLMFASGIGDAGLGSLAAGCLPGWVAHLTHGAPLSAAHSERVVLLCGCAVAALAIAPISRLRITSAVVIQKTFVLPSSPFLFRFLPAMALWLLVTGAFPPFANVYFVKHLGLSLERLGSVFSISQLVQFVAILAAPLVFRRMGLVAGVVITQLLTAAALFSLAGAHTPQHAESFYWLYMAAQYSNEPGIYSVLMNGVPPGERTIASSLTFFIGAGANIFASTAVGVSIVRFGYPAVLYTIALLAVAAAVLFLRLPRVPVTDDCPHPLT